jgi:hypothetical protein
MNAAAPTFRRSDSDVHGGRKEFIRARRIACPKGVCFRASFLDVKSDWNPQIAGASVRPERRALAVVDVGGNDINRIRREWKSRTRDLKSKANESAEISNFARSRASRYGILISRDM